MPENKENLIAGELLASVSILEILPTVQQKVEFADRAIKTVIGITNCGFCVKGYLPSPPIDVACRICSLKDEKRIDEPFDCPLEKSTDLGLISLTASESFFGYFIISGKESEQLIEYEHLLLNFLTILTISIDNLLKRIDLEKLNVTLHQSEEKFRSLFTEMMEGFALHEVICDEAGEPSDYRYLEMNPAFERILGLSRDSIIGKTSRDAFGVAEPPYFEIYTRVALTGEPIAFETWFPPMAKHFSISVYSPYKGSFATIFEDITGSKKAEQELRISLTKYQVLFNIFPIGITISDSEGRIIESNQIAETLLGISLEEQEKRLINSEEWNIVRPDGTIMPTSEYASVRALNESQKIDNMVMGIVKGKNPVTWINVSAAPMPIEGYGVAIVYNDITERKLAEAEIKRQNEELQKINAEKDKFFTIIAHDLKSPFNSILGFSEMLVENAREKNYESMEEYATVIHKSSKRAMDLLLNLMEWAQSQTGRMIFAPEVFKLDELTDEIILIFDSAAFQKKVQIKKVVPPETNVYADKAMISTILRNLISNAIKFSYPGGEISVSVKENKNGLAVAVSDAGIGIPKNIIGKLFQLDQNITTRGTQNERGTGLGLILCKEFIEKHGGNMGVESERGKGSKFYFNILNHAVITEKTDKNPTEFSEGNQIKKLKTLIAEDDKVSEMLIDSYIKMFGKEILKVSTGIEAVEACRHNPDIDLVLMDIQMPEMNGYEATRQIRQFNTEVIIIALTAFALTGDSEKAIEAGCNDYISKPIKKEELQKMINKCFGNLKSEV